LFDGGFGCFEGRHTKALILKAAHFEHSNAGSSLLTVYRKHTFVRYYELLKQEANIILQEVFFAYFMLSVSSREN
jgi:hypothetical protein